MSEHLTEFLWDMSLDQGHDEETGESETTGWFALFDWSTPDSKEEMIEFAKQFDCTDEEIAIINESVGAILSQVSSGLKDVKTFNSIDKLNEAWEEILSDTETDENE